LDPAAYLATLSQGGREGYTLIWKWLQYQFGPQSCMQLL